MMKKITKTFLIVLSIFLLIDNVDAKSLKSLKDQLAKDEANMASLIKKEKPHNIRTHYRGTTLFYEISYTFYF